MIRESDDYTDFSNTVFGYHLIGIPIAGISSE
jgi:hypothetical protein